MTSSPRRSRCPHNGPAPGSRTSELTAALPKSNATSHRPVRHARGRDRRRYPASCAGLQRRQGQRRHRHAGPDRSPGANRAGRRDAPGARHPARSPSRPPGAPPSSTMTHTTCIFSPWAPAWRTAGQPRPRSARFAFRRRGGHAGAGPAGQGGDEAGDSVMACAGWRPWLSSGAGHGGAAFPSVPWLCG